MTDANPEQSNGPELPATYRALCERYPAIGRLHGEMSDATRATGPLNGKVCELIKVAMCVGAGLESGLRSHVRRAMQQGATQQEVEQTILLGVTTLGFPTTMRAMSWAQVQFERQGRKQP